MSAPSELGIGVLGSGAMARAYCECLQKRVNGARALVVGGGSRAQALAESCRIGFSETSERVWSWPGVAAVIVATPETSHATLAMAAAGAGRHVLVEKPMAPDVSACDAMITACAAAGVQLMVVKHWRFRGVHTRAFECLRSGRHGRVVRIQNCTRVALASSLATVAQKPFYIDPSGGGLLMGWAVHNLDWVCHVIGSEPTDVRALAPVRTHDILGATSLDVTIRFASGAEADVSVAIDCPETPPSDRVFRSEVLTERGRLDLDGYGDLRESLGDAGWRTLWTQPHFNPRDASDPVRLEAYAAMVQAFVDSVRGGIQPPVTGHDGRRSVALFHAALAAMRSNGVVKL